jgi:hypothetical protein
MLHAKKPSMVSFRCHRNVERRFGDFNQEFLVVSEKPANSLRFGISASLP